MSSDRFNNLVETVNRIELNKLEYRKLQQRVLHDLYLGQNLFLTLLDYMYVTNYGDIVADYVSNYFQSFDHFILLNYLFLFYLYFNDLSRH